MEFILLEAEPESKPFFQRRVFGKQAFFAESDFMEFITAFLISGEGLAPKTPLW